MSAKVTRWAMVGIGAMATDIVADFRSTGNVELVALVSRSAEKGERFAMEANIPQFFTDLDAVLGLPDIDGVYLSTPPHAHFASAMAAILAGKHVLVEKPMTMTSEQARELVDLARETRVFLMEALWMRFIPAIRKALELVAAGEVGTVRSIQASCGYPQPIDPDSRSVATGLGAGSTFEQGILTVTLAYLVLGPPSSVVARGVLADGIDCESTILLGFPGGAQAVLTTSTTTFLPMTATISGTLGQIQLGEGFWHTDTVTLFRTDSTTDDFRFPPETTGCGPMLSAASAAILSGRTHHEWNPVSDTIAVLVTLEEAVGQITSGAVPSSRFLTSAKLVGQDQF